MTVLTFRVLAPSVLELRRHRASPCAGSHGAASRPRSGTSPVEPSTAPKVAAAARECVWQLGSDDRLAFVLVRPGGRLFWAASLWY
jgi:hypothetical protein